LVNRASAGIVGGAASHQEDVGRLDVAMDHPGPVCCVERIGKVDRQRQDLVYRRAAGDQSVAQGLACEPFHDDERLAVVLGDLMDRTDVRMVERRGGPRLAPETLHGVRVARHPARQELQRDLAAERKVLGAVDHAHPPAAEACLETVVTDSVARIHAATRRASRSTREQSRT
jgi:hypothetical protein